MDNKPRILELKERLNLVDDSIFYDKFDFSTRNKGEIYFLNNKISNIKNKDNSVSATVSGTKDYKVKIELYKNGNIKTMKCNCPHYKGGNNCKHLYALIIELKLKNNYKILNDYLDNTFNKFINKLNECNNYFNNNSNKYDDVDKKFYIDNFNKVFSNQIDLFNKRRESQIQEYHLLSLIKDIENTYGNMIKNFDDIKKKEKIIEKKKEVTYQKQEVTYEKPKEKNSILGGIFFGILKGLFSDSPREKRDKKMDKWINSEINNGNYEPYVAKNGFLRDDFELYDDEDYNDKEYRE